MKGITEVVNILDKETTLLNFLQSPPDPPNNLNYQAHFLLILGEMNSHYGERESILERIKRHTNCL